MGELNKKSTIDYRETNMCEFRNAIKTGKAKCAEFYMTDNSSRPQYLVCLEGRDFIQDESRKIEVPTTSWVHFYTKIYYGWLEITKRGVHAPNIDFSFIVKNLPKDEVLAILNTYSIPDFNACESEIGANLFSPVDHYFENNYMDLMRTYLWGHAIRNALILLDVTPSDN